MEEHVPAVATALSVVCEKAIAAYREHGRIVQAPAIRKVLESVIRQKHEHIAILRPLDPQFPSGAQPVSFPANPGPDDVLRGLVAHELSFAKTLDEFAAALQDTEQHQAVKVMADASRKFASWAQDHLDLLAMF
jgi:hypothetical protein